jgi:Protein of unknown function (DUF2798)
MDSFKSQPFFGIQKLPARYASVVMPLLLSLLMTCIVSIISTLKGVGWGATNFFEIWLGAWGLSWLVAFPVLLIALPTVRRFTSLLVQSA